jgi:hypothetical protein
LPIAHVFLNCEIGVTIGTCRVYYVRTQIFGTEQLRERQHSCCDGLPLFFYVFLICSLCPHCGVTQINLGSYMTMCLLWPHYGLTMSLWCPHYVLIMSWLWPQCIFTICSLCLTMSSLCPLYVFTVPSLCRYYDLQRFINAWSTLHQRFINVSSTLHQRFINASWTLHQRIMNGSSTHHQRIMNGSCSTNLI